VIEPPPGARYRDFPATIPAAEEAEAWWMAEGEALGIAPDCRFAIGLCLEELFLNAVQHGRASRVAIALWREPDGAGVDFRDDGQAFDPTLADRKRIGGPAEEFTIGGYGSGLVLEFSRDMSYRRVGPQNQITLAFDSSPSGAAPGQEALPAR
jgi:anti-sigma regulatory factor (Ser/Thr protein kinase)